MTRYVALLRGIAPSLPNMTNDRLRGVFTGLGFAKVSSVLASGNICFGSDDADLAALQARIEAALTERLGIHSTTIIRSLPTLRALLDSDPFSGLTHGPGSYLTATFLKEPADPLTGPLSLDDGSSQIIGHDAAAGAILAVTDNSQPGRTVGFMGWLEKTYGKAITTRTWLTVQRVVKRLEEG